LVFKLFLSLFGEKFFGDGFDGESENTYQQPSPSYHHGSEWQKT